VGGILVVLAPVIFAVSLFLTERPLDLTEAKFFADGVDYPLSVPAGEKQNIFAPSNVTDIDCKITDSAGKEVPLEPVLVDSTYSSGREEFTAIASFRSEDSELSIQCSELADSPVRIGQAASLRRLLTGLTIGIVVPLIIGTAGLLILIATGIRYASRPPRTKS
jgi:hypothetical protein